SRGKCQYQSGDDQPKCIRGQAAEAVTLDPGAPPLRMPEQVEEWQSQGRSDHEEQKDHQPQAPASQRHTMHGVGEWLVVSQSSLSLTTRQSLTIVAFVLRFLSLWFRLFRGFFWRFGGRSITFLGAFHHQRLG